MTCLNAMMCKINNVCVNHHFNAWYKLPDFDLMKADSMFMDNIVYKVMYRG